MKKTAKRIICIVLCVVMMTSLLAVGASAGGVNRPFRYVSFSDSCGLGYLLNDFLWDEEHDDKSAGASSFANFGNVMNYLKNDLHLRNVEGMDLGLCGMRPMELRAVLDKACYERFCTGDGSYCDSHVAQWMLNNKNQGKDPSYEYLSSTYTEAVKNADLITYDMIMADTASALLALTGGAKLCFGYSSYAELLKAEGCEFMGKTVEALRTSLEKLLGDSAAQLNGIIDSMLCTFAADAVHFSKSIELIYKLNPDVHLIVTGPYNSYDGICLDLGGVQIDFGKIYGVLVQALTTHMITDKNAWRYRFADCSGGVSTLKEALARGEIDQYDEYVDNIIKYALGDSKYTKKYNAEQIADMKAVITEVSKYNVFTLDGMIGAMTLTEGDKSLKRAITRDAKATEADYMNLAGMVFMGMGHNAGTHPDNLGYQQKFEATKRAFLSPVAANGALLTRILDGTFGIVNNTVGLVFGNKTSVMKFVDFIKDLFTPLLRISLK